MGIQGPGGFWLLLGLLSLVGMGGVGFLIGWFGYVAVKTQYSEATWLIPWILAVTGFGCAGVVGRTDPIQFGWKAFLLLGLYLTICQEAGAFYGRWKTQTLTRETRHLTVTVDGDERDATWEQGVGIYVSGHDFGRGDTVVVEGTPREVVEMRQMIRDGEAVTLVLKSEEVRT